MLQCINKDETVWRYGKIDFKNSYGLDRLKGKTTIYGLKENEAVEYRVIAGIRSTRLIMFLEGENNEPTMVHVFPNMNETQGGIHYRACFVSTRIIKDALVSSIMSETQLLDSFNFETSKGRIFSRNEADLLDEKFVNSHKFKVFPRMCNKLCLVCNPTKEV